jgi:hypothetical protein
MNNDNQASDANNDNQSPIVPTKSSAEVICVDKPYKVVENKVLKVLDDKAFFWTVFGTACITSIMTLVMIAMCYLLFSVTQTEATSQTNADEEMSASDLHIACSDLERSFAVASQIKLYDMSNSIVDGKCIIRVNTNDFSELLSEEYVKAFIELDKQEILNGISQKYKRNHYKSYYNNNCDKY